MTQILTTRPPSVRPGTISAGNLVSTREPTRASGGPELVETVRAAARMLIGDGAAGRDVAIGLVERYYRHLAEACPVAEDLRPWQLLASDLAAALDPVDPERAVQATGLAEEIRSTVVMIARNPEEELALRPASRRVLLELGASQGREELKVLRERCGRSESNLSNLLKPLRAHGLVMIEEGTEDRRARLVRLTLKGREAIAAAPERARVTQEYCGYIEATTPVAGVGAYSSALEAR